MTLMMNPVGNSILYNILITWAIITIINHWGCESPLITTLQKLDNTEGVRPLGLQQDWINSYEDGTVVSWIQGLQVTLWAVDTLVDW